jgi:hypothetical protein
LKKIGRSVAIYGLENREASSAKQFADSTAERFLIFHDEYGFCLRRRTPDRGRSPGNPSWTVEARQEDLDSSTSAGSAHHMDRPAARSHNSLHYRESAAGVVNGQAEVGTSARPSRIV